jgi:GNAT superfamily N-acetyltransferase
MYRLVEVDGANAAEVLRDQNQIAFAKYPLTDDHLDLGYWWLLKTDSGTLCGFCGLVPNEPFPGVGYCKRAYISPDHRGRGLQLKMLEARIEKAQELGWHLLVSETTSVYAAHNFARAGFEPCEPEQKWGEPGSQYFRKLLV